MAPRPTARWRDVVSGGVFGLLFGLWLALPERRLTLEDIARREN